MNGFISSPFPPTSARALYQGTTLVVPKHSPQRWALAPVPISSTFCSLGAYPDFLLHHSRRRPLMWFSLKENHMQLTEAATLYRKFRGSRATAVPRTLLGYVFRNEGKRRSYPPLTFASFTIWESPGMHATPYTRASRNLARQSPPHR